VFRTGAGSAYSMRNTTQTAAAIAALGGKIGGTGTASQSGQIGGALAATGAGTGPGDFDLDGITDPNDDCPSVSAPATANGCPARPAKVPDTDTDGDGIPDIADACPTTPAGPNDANGDGCPDPVVTPTPTPSPTPVTQPSGNPPPSTGGSSTTQPERILVTLTFFARSGAKSSKFTSLKVRNVPLGATVNVTCKGKGCPKGLKGKGYTKRNAFGAVNLKKFIKKPLRVGVTITVVVSRPNAIDAVKILKVRRSKAPAISTRCIRPGSTRQVACA
jgi:hypothetical protein